MSPARCARCPCRQWGGPSAGSQPHDFLEIGNFAPFSEFLLIKGQYFPEFFPFKSTYDPYEPWKVSWKSVLTFSDIRNTDTQTDRRGNFIYLAPRKSFDILALYKSDYYYYYYYIRKKCEKFTGIPTAARVHRSSQPVQDFSTTIMVYGSLNITILYRSVRSMHGIIRYLKIRRTTRI